MLPRLLSLLAAILLLARPTQAQTLPDTTGVRYTQETVADSDPDAAWLAGLSKLTRLQIEEHRLWKIGLTQFAFGSASTDSRYGLNFIYEHKLRTNWSVMAEISPALLRYRPLPTTARRTGAEVESQVAARYYYNLNRRIRKGKSASNFSANYLSLALGSSLGRYGFGTPFTSDGSQGQSFRASAALLYGFQRRLGRYGFFDLMAGLPLPLSPRLGPLFPKNSLNLLLDFRLGLALGR
ncbi:hypothetical protein Q5H93_15670 [Hymenobacter sp. ASUV-10]|uniref:Alpha-defensin N-terminal domain-containing protein n=1 Tax=Hymenobacter aranciens TaxID=3063996 RepID=A0ABT9BD57_9BACT|nr:hypothetical protein [Hymenobacter sp. ASUV-10]MDO7876183.1 hypothetical protein [Hymenobacter sp. ASUV-10]